MMSLFIDVSGDSPGHSWDFWEPLVIPRAGIDAEVARLSQLPAPANGRRESLVVHPYASAPGNGLAPGIRVTLSVLLPGESTAPLRQNSTQVSLCITGGGTAAIGTKKISFGQFDIWNCPPWTSYHHINDTDTTQVRLTYSNAALLDHLGVHLVEANPPADTPASGADGGELPKTDTDHLVGMFRLTDQGAGFKPYESFIDLLNVKHAVAHWPWPQVQNNLDRLSALAPNCHGRQLFLLYDPEPGHTNSTAASFFATMPVRSSQAVECPRHHVSATVSYYFHGHGHRLIDGKRYDWEAGDLMFSAPGWTVHHHASGDQEPARELIIQDLPLHMALESPKWQHDLKRPGQLSNVEPSHTINQSTQ